MRAWLTPSFLAAQCCGCGSTERDTVAAAGGAQSAGGSASGSAGSSNSGGSASGSGGNVGGSASGSGGNVGGSASGSGGSVAGQAGSAGGGGATGGPSAQAGLNLLIAAATPPIVGKACPVVTLRKEIGMPAPTPSSPGVRIVDGELGSSVSCEVTGQGTFDVAAQIEFEATAFVLMGQVEAGGVGTASVTVYTPETGTLVSSTTECTIDVSTSPFQVTDGSIWAAIDCAAIEAAPSTGCEASGILVLENCQGLSAP